MRDKQDELSELSGVLRQDTLYLYKLTGNKKLVGGLGIRITKVLEYDKGEAFKWATEHKMALSLDARAFEKIAKSTPIDLVTIKEVATATIPQKIDLNALGGNIK